MDTRYQVLFAFIIRKDIIMRALTRIKLTILVLFIVFTTSVCTARPSDLTPTPTPKTPLTASLSEITGLVQVLKPVDGFFKDAFNGQNIQVKDQVLTHQDSRVRIDLSNGTMFRIGPFSSFILQEMEEQEDGIFTRLKLQIGKIWIILKGGAVDVETPSGVASVVGSYLFVEVIPGPPDSPDDIVTLITCLEGECVLENEGGSVTLGAGETAMVLNAQVPPTPGKMSHNDVNQWILFNPEATLVVVPLTATPTPGQDTPEQTEETTTPTPTMTKTLPAGDTPTPTQEGMMCGPPGDWVIYTVQAGETLEGLGYLFRLPASDLQFANCMGDSTVITAGMNIFVPNVSTSTPTLTPTITLTPKPTNTKTPKPTSTTKPTATQTPTNTEIPSESNAVFFNISGPTGTIDNCLNYYKTDVIDPDGINFVKLYFDVNSEPSTGDSVLMDNIGGNSYQKHNFEISTSAPGTDTVKYRFMVKDNLGNVQYYPALASSPYEYADSLDCGNTPTAFEAPFGPEGTITDPLNCTNPYMIDVNDSNGISNVYLAYSLDGGPYNHLTMAPHTVDGSGNGTYEIITLIDTTSKAPNPATVYYKFKAEDGLSNLTYSSPPLSFTDNVNCGP